MMWSRERCAGGEEADPGGHTTMTHRFPAGFSPNIPRASSDGHTRRIHTSHRVFREAGGGSTTGGRGIAHDP